MLTGVEFVQCENILKLLQPDDIVSLKNTVTQNRVATTTVKEAKDTILQYSNSGKELLQRKKMKRDFLFKYLHEQGKHVDPKKEKDGLIQFILDYWDSLKGDTITNPPIKPNESAQFGAEFLDIFFGLLKEMAHDSETTSWGASYFAKNCKLVVSEDLNDFSVENYIGAEMCAQTLGNLARIHKLFFLKQELKSFLCDSVVVVTVKGDVKKLVFPELSVAIAKFEQTFHLQQTSKGEWIIKLCDLDIKKNTT